MPVELFKGHTGEYHIHTFDVDLNGKVFPHVLFSMMVDSASLHVKGSQFSYEALRGEGQLWVLSRFLAIFHDLPDWNDIVTVETWGKGINRLFGLRDFIITSHDNKKLVSATSAWLLIDRKTSRPQRLDKLKENFPFQSDKQELEIELEKISALNSGVESDCFTTHFTDMDLNRHISSTKYFQWILDSYPEETLKFQKLHSFEINFLAEAHINEAVKIYIEKNVDFDLCEIKREPDNVTLCRARVIWK